MMAYPYSPSAGRMPMPQPYRGAPAQQPYGGAPSQQPYGAPPTSYPSSQQQGSATAHQSSKDMDDLLRNLTSLMKDATPQDLQQLGNNEDRINDLIKDSEQTKQLQRRRTALAERNKDLAVTNISMRPEFDLLKDKLIELTQEQNTLLEQYSLLQSEISGLVSLDTTLALLQTSCAEKEAESERVSEALLDQEKSVDEFIEEFMPLRKDYYLRKIKSDKFSVVLNERNRPTPAPRQRFGNYQSSYGGY